MREDDLICKICGKEFQHLGSHIWHKHKITAREYKKQFGLPYNMALISREIKRKKQVAFEKDRERYLKNIQEFGNEYQFKKGQSGHRRISQRERENFIERIEEVNEREPEKCPVCNMIFDNLDSHLYNKHQLLRVKEIVKKIKKGS